MYLIKWFLIKNRPNIFLEINPSFDRISSNKNEGIRAVLFLLRKDFTCTKSTKTHISEQKQKRQHFYALKKHLRGRKSLIRLFAFLCFLCAFYAFCAFLCVKQKRQHFYAHKNI